MNSTKRYLPKNPPPKFDMSPFTVRKPSHEATSYHGESKESILDTISPLQATSPPRRAANRISSIQQWLHPRTSQNEMTSAEQQHQSNDASTSKQDKGEKSSQVADMEFKPADKALRNQWTLKQFHANSLHPSVADSEAAEYERYVTHPLRLPLVVSEDPEPERPTSSLVTTKSTLPETSDSPQPTRPPLDKASSTYVEFAEYLGRSRPNAGDAERDEDVLEFEHFLRLREDALGVTSEDWEKKRYQAYRKWLLRGKSLFKQSKVDPEFSQAT